MSRTLVVWCGMLLLVLVGLVTSLPSHSATRERVKVPSQIPVTPRKTLPRVSPMPVAAFGYSSPLKDRQKYTAGRSSSELRSFLNGYQAKLADTQAECLTRVVDLGESSTRGSAGASLPRAIIDRALETMRVCGVVRVTHALQPTTISTLKAYLDAPSTHGLEGPLSNTRTEVAVPLALSVQESELFESTLLRVLTSEFLGGDYVVNGVYKLRSTSTAAKAKKIDGLVGPWRDMHEVIPSEFLIGLSSSLASFSVSILIPFYSETVAPQARTHFCPATHLEELKTPMAREEMGDIEDFVSEFCTHPLSVEPDSSSVWFFDSRLVHWYGSTVVEKGDDRNPVELRVDFSQPWLAKTASSLSSPYAGMTLEK